MPGSRNNECRIPSPKTEATGLETSLSTCDGKVIRLIFMGTIPKFGVPHYCGVSNLGLWDSRCPSSLLTLIKRETTNLKFGFLDVWP
jgi:hypothetical protein